MQRSSNADELKELIERGSGLNDAYGGGTRPATRPRTAAAARTHRPEMSVSDHVNN